MLGEKVRISRGAYLLFISAAFVVVLMGMRSAQYLFSLFLLSLFFAVICAPFFTWMRRRGVPTAVALLIVVVGFLGVLMAVVSIAATSANEFRQNLPYYQGRLSFMMQRLQAWLSAHGVQSSETIEQSLNPAAFLRYAAETLAGLSSVLSNALIIILMIAFMLLEAANFPAKLQRAFARENASLDRLDAFLASLKRYMGLKTLTCLATGLCVGTFLAVQGVDYYILWGLLAFLFNYIPSIGSFVAAIPAVLLSLVQFGLNGGLITAGGYILINVTIGNVIEPRLMGRGLGLSTLVVFMSLFFWGWVLGPVGMLLAVPLTMTVKIALESSEQTRWIAVLMSGDTGDSVATAVAREETERLAEPEAPAEQTAVGEESLRQEPRRQEPAAPFVS